jgi:hypothetical protein
LVGACAKDFAWGKSADIPITGRYCRLPDRSSLDFGQQPNTTNRTTRERKKANCFTGPPVNQDFTAPYRLVLNLVNLFYQLFGQIPGAVK